jgi:hypothetical protein
MEDGVKEGKRVDSRKRKVERKECEWEHNTIKKERKH